MSASGVTPHYHPPWRAPRSDPGTERSTIVVAQAAEAPPLLGSHLARALLAQGQRVSLLGRDFAPVADLLAAGAQPIRCDLTDTGAVIAACQGHQAVCHVGALSAPWGRRADFLAINVDATAAILAGCRRAGVERLVFVSSPSVLFNGRDHHRLTEAAPYPARFTSVYAESKKLAEDLVNAAPDVPAVILRPKAIFGPGDRSLLPRLLAAARAGRLPQIGAGTNLVDLTYVGNVVQAMLLALTAREAVGKSYLITNDEHVPLWSTIRQLVQRLGLPPLRRRLPLALAWSAARLMEGTAAMTGREPLLTRYTVAILSRTQTYEIAAAKRDLGYAPDCSVTTGIEHTLAALQASES